MSFSPLSFSPMRFFAASIVALGLCCCEGHDIVGCSRQRVAKDLSFVVDDVLCAWLEPLGILWHVFMFQMPPA